MCSFGPVVTLGHVRQGFVFNCFRHAGGFLTVDSMPYSAPASPCESSAVDVSFSCPDALFPLPHIFGDDYVALRNLPAGHVDTDKFRIRVIKSLRDDVAAHRTVQLKTLALAAGAGCRPASCGRGPQGVDGGLDNALDSYIKSSYEFLMFYTSLYNRSTNFCTRNGGFFFFFFF